MSTRRLLQGRVVFDLTFARAREESVLMPMLTEALEDFAEVAENRKADNVGWQRAGV